MSNLCNMLKTLPFLLLFTRGLFAAYRGIFTLDCEEAAGPCNNACYYINCLNGGSNVFMSHGNDPDPNPKRKRNTARSGASVTGGPPCRKLPFSQKFYDTYPNWQNMGVDEQLETDEFPMAAFKQQDFQLGAWPPRNTLRCVPRVQNGRKLGRAMRALLRTVTDCSFRSWSAILRIPSGQRYLG